MHRSRVGQGGERARRRVRMRLLNPKRKRFRAKVRLGVARAQPARPVCLRGAAVALRDGLRRVVERGAEPGARLPWTGGK